MRKLVVAIFFGAAAFSASSASVLESWRDLKARYTIFSGEQLSGREAPTSMDRKLAILVEGQEAKEIFDFIGPDVPSCSQRKGDRDRSKQGVQCTFTAYPTPKGYRCWIGIDLRTGKSISTVSC